MGDWEVINQEIERSKIQRINWKKLLGMTLTRAILQLKKDGLTAIECYNFMKDKTVLKDYLSLHFSIREKLLHNLYISVHARYGETNTARKILRGK